MFLQPRTAFPRQSVSHTSLASGLRRTFLSWFLTSNCDSGFKIGSEASIFPETSQQPGASYNSPREFHLDGIKDVSKPLFQLWLFAEAMFEQCPSNVLLR